MHPQKRDIINAELRVFGTLDKSCADCNRQAKRFSCYCQECEDKIYQDESH